MSIGVDLLREGGQFCFIVPRSYASGAYFRKFRHQFHRAVTLEHIHLFRSRSSVFREQDVLQETLIVAGRRSLAVSDDPVCITASEGVADLWAHSSVTVRHSRVVDTVAPECWIRIPESERDVAVLEALDSLPERLGSLGLHISTGPVVPFRAPHLLRTAAGTHPLLWMQHVRSEGVIWPLPSFRKPQWLSSETPPARLVPNQPMVLLRRFSAKEDPRRLVASPLTSETTGSEFVGLENHLNYIQARGMQRAGAIGLARFLNSEPVDRYFRMLNGSTQVNATEIRAMPLPSRAQIEGLGTSRLDSSGPLLETIPNG